MKRAGIITVILLIAAYLLVAAVLSAIEIRDRHIADLEERNAALSRLCGPDPNAPEVQP